MKVQPVLIGIVMLFLMVAAVSASSSSTTSTSGSSSSTSTSSVSASTTVSAEEALSEVYVSSVTVDPQVFYPGDQGTITVQLTNTGTQDVAFEHADILNSQNIYIPDERSNPYQVMTYLGPGNTMTYTFDVVAKGPDEIYYPDFSVASRDSDSIIYPIKVQVDSTPVQEAITQKPNYFALNNTDTVNLTITNPRAGAINNVEITPSGTGFATSPLQDFITSVPGDSSVSIPFALTPQQAGSNVTFIIQYSNGQTIQNPHTDTVILPLTLGQSNDAATMDINDLALTVVNGAYQLTGDVTNTGVTNANGVEVLTGAPAQPAEPYSTYAVGSLTANDFSSFTLTFTANDLSAIPVTTQWRDDNGNLLTSTQTFDLRSLASAAEAGSKGESYSGSSGTSGYSSSGGYGGGAARGGLFGIGGGRSGGLSAFFPVIIGGIVIIVAVALYVKRKWLLGKIRKQ